MSEQSPSGIGTVAQEAARLIEDMATMARSSYSRGDGSSLYAGAPAQEPVSPDAPAAADPAGEYAAGEYAAGGTEAADDSAEGACSQCGAARGQTSDDDTSRDDTSRDDTSRDDTSSSCRLCPLCRGFSLLRSVRPETVDLLADLAISVAANLRDVAARSRESDPASSTRSTPGGPPDTEHVSVQNIPVDDESEG